MLLEASEPDVEMVPSIQSWDSNFTTDFQHLMEPFGWQVERNEETRRVYHTPPPPKSKSSSWVIVRKKAHPFLHTPFLFNPLFEIYYRSRFVGKIKVDVQGWSTDYNYQVNVSFIHLLPLVEKLPFDDLVRHRITDFLAPVLVVFPL
jgi:hypothetical protein